MTGEKIRRGMAFGGFALVLGIVVMPLALNVFYSGPIEPLLQSIIWLVIAVVAAFGFYLGYTGWGQ